MSKHKTLEKLRRKLRPTDEARSADAAVALLLKAVNDDFKILIVKRAENPSDPWSGQMAFPGGKCDSKDRGLRQTVVRETYEETGINLEHHCRFLGVLENLKSTVKPELLVAPFVVLLEYEPHIILNEELKGYFWISLRTLQKHKATATFPFGEVPAYIFEGNVVWGLTYRILEKFTQI